LGLGLAVAAAATPAISQEKITLAHALPNLSPSFAIASSLPVALGYWKEEGLDVDVVTTPGASAAMQLVVGGRADAAWGNPTGAMVAIQRGAPVKFYFVSLRGDIFGIGLPKGSGLKALNDLKGKTVGVSSFASGGANYAKALLKQSGLAESDYSMVEIGVGARAAAALRSGQVQALSLWDEAYKQMEENGIAMDSVITDERASSLIAGSIVTRNEEFDKRRKMLVGLARGIAKAQLFQEHNPEASVRIHWKVYPQNAPRAGITDEEVKKAAVVIDVRRKIQSQGALGTGRFGDVPLDHLKKFQSYLVETNQLPEVVDVNRYYTDDLIAEINNFNKEDIIRQAKSYKPN
jgi:NitT/TauT family transport system substrate-binding protein